MWIEPPEIFTSVPSVTAPNCTSFLFSTIHDSLLAFFDRSDVLITLLDMLSVPMTSFVIFTVNLMNLYGVTSLDEIECPLGLADILSRLRIVSNPEERSVDPSQIYFDTKLGLDHNALSIVI